MQRKETAIEVKVGALVIVALALFTGFIFVLGDFTVGRDFKIYVDLENAGGLKPGADVRVAGIPAGTVDTIEFRGGEWDDEVGRHVYVRLHLLFDKDMTDAVGEGAEFVVTTQGVLGEPYIEVVNATPPGPPVAEGSKFLGQTPIRIDQMLRSVYDGLQGLNELIDTVDRFFDESDLQRLLTETADLAAHLDEVVVASSTDVEQSVESLNYVLEQNRDRIAPILENVEVATAEFAELGRRLNAGLGDGSDIRATIRSLRRVTSDFAEHSDETFADLASTLDSIERIVSEGEDDLALTVANIADTSDNLVVASGSVAELAAYVNDGRGTLGGLIRDDELYDDIRELLRELKRRPWRLIWKE
jgi:phospholipid/cholesterol/gamma-HCH transport system substrate-binding protein